MISTSRIAGLAVVAALVLTAGCDDSLAPVWWAEDGPVEVVVQTEADLYEGRIVPYTWSRWGGWRIEISGHYRIENRGERSVWVTDWPPSLQGHFGGEWIWVYHPVVFLPGNQPTGRLAPGEHMTVPFTIWGHSPETNTYPRWTAPDVEGTFRLADLGIITRPASDGEAIPAEMRRSNSFELRTEWP